MGQDKNEQISKFIEYVNESNSIVFFGGAGVSTESGVPDFRSKDGLYNQHDIRFEKYEPEYLLSHDCLMSNPKVFYEYYRQKMDARDVEPNVTHYALAKLEEKGKLSAIVTQNIDGLHQKAGSKKVYEIHGTTLKNYCARCGKTFEKDAIFDGKYNDSEMIPRCDCGGQIRPQVTLYQEGLPDEDVNGALAAISSADMLIVAGTSLRVYPAASFVNYFRGKHIVVINREPIGMQLGKDDLCIICSMGEVFKELHLD